jgi:hypothetical protein
MRLPLTRAAMWFGVVMLAVGILGFIPGITSNYYLFHFIKVGIGPNLVHIIMGIAGISAAATETMSRTYLRTLAVIYLVLGVIGLFMPDGEVFGFMATNWWTELGRGILLVATATLGWSAVEEQTPAPAPRMATGFGERMDEPDDL